MDDYLIVMICLVALIFIVGAAGMGQMLRSQKPIKKNTNTMEA